MPTSLCMVILTCVQVKPIPCLGCETKRELSTSTGVDQKWWEWRTVDHYLRDIYQPSTQANQATSQAAFTVTCIHFHERACVVRMASDDFGVTHQLSILVKLRRAPVGGQSRSNRPWSTSECPLGIPHQASSAREFRPVTSHNVMHT